MNPRELLRSSTTTSSPYSTSSSTWQYQRPYYRKQQRQERSKPREIPTHSRSMTYTVPSTIKTQAPKPEYKQQPQRKATTEAYREKEGNRFALFHGDPPKYIATKVPFVAMVSEAQWNSGFRPGFLLGLARPCPEKYYDAKKMFEIYKKTGNLVYPYSGKKPVDKVKTTANEYQYRNTSVKKK